jgi:TetR/AcrR family transcriptional regulator, transcriptional repressor for nem operon
VTEDGVENVRALLSQQGGPSDPADAAQARARILDVLSRAVRAIPMSRLGPDDSPFADEILAVHRDAILGSQWPPCTEKVPIRKRKAG